MTENSAILKVGSIIQMDGVHQSEAQRGELIAQLLQFEDIYLTESEDFWQEQPLDGEKLLFQSSLSSKTMAELVNERPIDKLAMTDAPTSSTGMSMDNLREDDIVMIGDEGSLPGRYIGEPPMIKFVVIDAQASLTGTSFGHSETSVIDNGRLINDDLSTEEPLMSDVVDPSLIAVGSATNETR